MQIDLYAKLRRLWGSSASRQSPGRARVYAAVLSFAIATALVITYAGIRCRDVYMLDGFSGCVLPLLFTEDTEYAPSYSHAAFLKLRKGMSYAEVATLLGPALEIYPVEGSREGWRWSRSHGDRSYRVRVAIFDEGRVSEIIHKFYLD